MRYILQIILSFLPLFFTGCQDETETLLPGTIRQAATFTAVQSNTDVATRATDQHFETGDAIGIYVVKKGGNAPGTLQPSGNYADNKRYVIASDGTLQPFGKSDKIYFSSSETYDIYAYYPYDKEINNPLQFTFKVRQWHTQTTLTQSDFMLATVKGFEGSSSVTLHFQRKLALIEINFQKTPEIELHAGYVVGVKNSVSVNFESGDVITQSDSGVIYLNQYDENENYKIYRCIIPVQTLKNEGELFDFDYYYGTTVGTVRYRATTNTPLAAGTKSTYYINMQYKVNVEVVGGAGANITGAGAHNHGQTVTLTAFPANNYQLLGWYLSDGKPFDETLPLLSTANPYTFEITKETKIFARIGKAEHLITTVGSEDEALIITPSQKVTQGTYHKVSVSPKYGYIFLGWYENGQLVTTDKDYTFPVTCPRTLEARFKYEVFKITSTPEHNEEFKEGSVFGGGVWMRGEPCSIEATAKYGYNFDGWYENGKLITTSGKYQFIVSADRHLEAKFSPKYHYFEIVVEGAPANLVTGATTGYYPSETEFRLVASTNGNYYFNGWYENGIMLGNSIYYGVRIWENRKITAKFTKL